MCSLLSSPWNTSILAREKLDTWGPFFFFLLILPIRLCQSFIRDGEKNLKFITIFFVCFTLSNGTLWTSFVKMLISNYLVIKEGDFFFPTLNLMAFHWYEPSSHESWINDHTKKHNQLHFLKNWLHTTPSAVCQSMPNRLLLSTQRAQFSMSFLIPRFVTVSYQNKRDRDFATLATIYNYM